MSRNSCTHLKQVNLDAEAKTKWDLIGYIYGFVYHVVMLYAVILQKINMALNTSKQQLILSSSHLNPARIGNGVMLTRYL
jgi:hypothetical protein